MQRTAASVGARRTVRGSQSLRVFLLLLTLLGCSCKHHGHAQARLGSCRATAAGAAVALTAAAAAAVRPAAAAAADGGRGAATAAAAESIGGEVGAAAAAAGEGFSQHRRRLLAPAPRAPASTGSATAPCRPSIRAVAAQQPELSQLMELGEVGYDVFAVDSRKPFTVLAPTDAALQQLAEGIVNGDEQLLLQDGFYSVLLYHQLPEGAYNLTQLLTEQEPDGLLTSLGKAMRKKYTVTFDDSTMPVVATGGWPANNAPLLSSHKACDGSWLHIIGAVLLPAKRLSNLPRLVDNVPDLQNDSFWGLLDGNALLGGGGATAPAPADGGGGGQGRAPPAPAHTNPGIVISDGNGNGTDTGGGSGSGSMPVDGSSSSGSSSGDSKVLIVAASAAGGAVLLCALLVGGVLLRKRQLRRRRQQHQWLDPGQRGEAAEEEDDEFEVGVSKNSLRPVQVHVDA